MLNNTTVRNRHGENLSGNNSTFSDCHGCNIFGNNCSFKACHGCNLAGNNNTVIDCHGCNVDGNNNTVRGGFGNKCSGNNNTFPDAPNKKPAYVAPKKHSLESSYSASEDDGGVFTSTFGGGSFSSNISSVNLGNFGGNVVISNGNGAVSQSMWGGPNGNGYGLSMLQTFGDGSALVTLTNNRGTVRLKDARGIPDSQLEAICLKKLEKKRKKKEEKKEEKKKEKKKEKKEEKVAASPAPAAPLPKRSKLPPPEAKEERVYKEEEIGEGKAIQRAELCSICLEREKRTMLSPCKHIVMCLTCTRKICTPHGATCPTCRTEVEHVEVVYLS